MARLKSCPYCGKIHTDVQNCTNRLRNENRNDKDKFRSSTAWKKKREEIKQRDLYCCRICLEQGIVNNSHLHVHHIISLDSNFDMRLDNTNLISLCSDHHNRVHNGEFSQADLSDLVTREPKL